MEHSDLNALGTLMSNMGWIQAPASEAGVSYLGFQISWEALSGTDFGKTVFLDVFVLSTFCPHNHSEWRGPR